MPEWLVEFSAHADTILTVLAYLALSIAMVGMVFGAVRMLKGWWDAFKR